MLPEEVPELQASHIRRWASSGGSFCCDLSEWSDIVFGCWRNPRLEEIVISVFQKAGVRAARLGVGVNSDEEAHLLATAWNTYIEELGYTEQLPGKWSRP